MNEIKDQWVWFVDEELVPALVRAEPTDPQVQRRGVASQALVKAVVSYLEGRPEEALTELSKNAKDGVYVAESCAAMGYIQFEMGRFDAAILSYARVAQIDSGSRIAYYNLGLCYERMKRYKEAAGAFEKAVEVDPKRADAWLGLGVCLLHVKKPKQAIEALSQSLDRDPRNQTAMFGKAVAHQMQWQFDQASDLYKKLLELNPDSEELLVNMTALGIARKD